MRLKTFLFTALLPALAANAAEPGPGRNYVGINPWFLSDWDGSNAFADMAVHGRNWQAAADWHDTVAIDAEGWPLADASTVFFGEGTQPGRYHLKVEGRIDGVELMWAPGTVDSLAWDATTNITTAVVNLEDTQGNSGGLVLRGTRRAKGDPAGTGFRNLHLYRPGIPADGSRLYTDAWEGLMRRFDAVRFMDWGSTNSNPLVSWSDRRRPSFAARPTPTIGGKTGDIGLPYEYMVELCNRTNTDAWINVPVMADSAYVANLVKTVLNGSDGTNPYPAAVTNPVWKPLAPGLKLYLEYGNELWNFGAGFWGFHWLHEQSEALRAGARTEPIFFDGQNEEWGSLFRLAGWRASQTSLWARAAAGDAAMMTRVRPVFEGQIGYHALAGTALDFLEQWYAQPRAGRTRIWRIKDLFWGSGSAPYSNLAGNTADEVFARGAYPESYVQPAVASDALLAAAYGLHRVAYEGGPSTEKLPEAIRPGVLKDPRMKDLLTEHHRMWTRRGGELAMYYCAAGGSTWSFATAWDDTLSQKMRAIDALREDTAASSTLGCVAPCRERVDTLDEITMGGFWREDSAQCGLDPTDWIAYPVSIPAAGSWALTVHAKSDGVGDSMDVMLADSLVATVVSGSSEEFADLPAVTMSLPAGLNAVRLHGRSGSFRLRALDWKRVAGTGIQVKGSVGTATRNRLLLQGARGLRSAIETGFVPASLEVRSLDGRLLERQEIAPGQGSVGLSDQAAGLRVVVLEGQGRREARTVLVR